jgi:hypothetical protein
MHWFGHRLLRHALFITASLWTMAATACNVPVFRYALERWEADPYEIVVFHREPLTAESQKLVGAMEKAGQDGLANLTVMRVDLTGEMSQPLRTLWNAQENPAPPWMVVRYPRHLEIERSVSAGPLSAETARTLLKSPARRDISQKLLRGDAVVWLLLECGNQKLDDQARQLVEAESRKLQQTLVLPEPSPLDPPMDADLPLKIAFSTVRVARADPAERMLVNMLLNWNTNLTAATEAMLFPVFGRGRVVPPAIGQEIQAEAIREMAEFLTGPCSCQVKEMNPGYDLLLSANWSSLVGHPEARLQEPPPLVSMAQFAATAASHATATSLQAPVSPAPSSTPPAPVRPGHLVRNLVVVLGIGVVVLAATTFGLKVRAQRRPR